MKHVYTLIFALIFLVCAGTLSAQKEGNIWHFGYNQVIDFTSGTPVLGAHSEQTAFEGCASFCDSAGNLLFYTNGGLRYPMPGQTGGAIWNKAHEVMYDMHSVEGGGNSATQSSVIFPKPGAPGRYCLFTMDETEYIWLPPTPGQPFGRGLSYFEIDMTMNGGLGGVADYKEAIYVPTIEGLCAIRQPNGIDYWVVIHNTAVNGLLCYPVTVQGIGLPVFNHFGTGIVSMIKASPDGRRIMRQRSITETVIYDFDALTGLISNPDTLPLRGFSTFSPDSRRFFISTYNGIYAYDVSAPGAAATEKFVGKLPQVQDGHSLKETTQMQIGPDGRIYIAGQYSDKKVYLAAITCPNANPKLKPNILQLFDSEHTFFGFPNYAEYLFAEETVPLPISIGDKLVICANEPLTINSNISGLQYSWSTGANASNITVSQVGVYTVSVTDGCRTGVDSVSVILSELNVAAGPDQTICEGTTVTMAGNATAGSTLSWEFSEAPVSDNHIGNPTSKPDITTDYILEASLDGCVVYDTLSVVVQANINGGIAFSDTLIESGESVQLFASGGTSYNWTPATGISCSDCPNPIATPSDSVDYTVYIVSANTCPDTLLVRVRVNPPDCRINMPNAFTPNGDLSNDTFQPVADYSRMDLRIYSRWGQLVYQGNTPWDGRVDDTDAPSDVYVYQVNLEVCGASQSKFGELTLLR